MHTKQATVRDGGAGASRGMQHDPDAGQVSVYCGFKDPLFVWTAADCLYHSVPPGALTAKLSPYIYEYALRLTLQTVSQLPDILWGGSQCNLASLGL